eukprot:gene28545-37699_t
MEDVVEEPPAFKGEVVFSHIGEDIGPETSRSNLIPSFTSSTAASSEFTAIKTESLSHARVILKEELNKLLSSMNETEDNTLKLKIIDEGKKPYLFLSIHLVELLETTPSLKTKITIIKMIAPRLMDPRAKSEYFIGLFRFSEQKDIVKAALKSRMHTINSAIFSRTEISHSSPAMDDSALLSTPQSKLMRRLTNIHSRSSGRGSRMRKREEESSMKDDMTLATTSRESSQNDVPSSSSTPIKSSVRNLVIAMDDDFLSPYNLDKVVMKSPTKKSIAVADSIEEYEGNHHTQEYSNNSFSAISHAEFANNVFSTPSAQVEIADKAHRLGQQYQSSTNSNFHHKHSSDRYLAVPTPGISISSREFRFSDCGILDSAELISSSQSNNPKSSQASTITLSIPTLAGETTLPLPSPIDGWLCKYSRRGIFKNWKRRYFVLKEGKLAYYGEMSSPMVGKTLKGEINLRKAIIALDEKSTGRKQFQITVHGGVGNMLVEAESETMANDWIIALNEHAMFAT